ncbi:hypothetical protein VCHENC02_1131A, partial [Vibrio harveyi]
MQDLLAYLRLLEVHFYLAVR